MRRRSMPTASGLAIAILLGLIAVPAHPGPLRPHVLRPLWVEPASEPMPAPYSDLSATATRNLVADPLDVNWIGMPLPTLFSMKTPTGNVEFGGKLILAGPFSTAGSIAAHTIVSWDGSQFGSMGNPGMSAQSLAIWNGVLYAGGTTFQGQGFVSRWDGSSWTPVGTATGGQFNSPQITSLEVFNGDLVAAGDFFTMGGVPALRVARFDGASWHAMGSGFTDKPVTDLQTVGSDLYIGGVISGGIRRWDGVDWVAVGPGLNGTVTEMTTDGTNLYVAGGFSKAGADSVPGVAKWNGSQWQRVGLGTAPNVASILWWNGQLVAGVVDGASQVSRFDGNHWAGLGGPWTSSSSVRLLGTFGTQLVGLGSNVPQTTGDAVIGATYDGSTWTPVREAWSPDMLGIGSQADAATVWNDRLVAVGDFSGVANGGAILHSTCEAMFDGTSWSTFGAGTGAGIQAVCATTWGSDLVAGGWVSRGIIQGDRDVALWNGSAWQLPGSAMPPYAWSLVEYLGDLYAGGDFTFTIGPPQVTVNHIARWNGTVWSALGSGLSLSPSSPDDPNCYALASWNGLLVVGGEFDHAGGTPAENIATWDGGSWSTLGAGLDGTCEALSVWNGHLVVGGGFAHAGGLAAPGAAMWDGTSWHAMSDEAVDVFDFAQIAGTLYAVGLFHGPDGSVVNNVARWDGTNWHLLGSGAQNPYLLWVEGYHGDLYAGGSVSFAFGKATAAIIRLPGANTVGVDDGPMVTGLSLAASPNPSRAGTAFAFALPRPGHARLAVFDAAGREVARLLDGDVLAGRHEVRWTAPAKPGVYFARLEVPGGEKRLARVVRFE